MRNTDYPDHLARFRDEFEKDLIVRYTGHWHPQKKHKGSAYRCIRRVDSHLDPVLQKAASAVDLPIREVLKLLPHEITLWVDPEEVAYRFGEEGSIGILYTGSSPSSSSEEEEETIASSDSEMSVSSSSASNSPASISPSTSPTRDFLRQQQIQQQLQQQQLSNCRNQLWTPRSAHYSPAPYSRGSSPYHGSSSPPQDFSGYCNIMQNFHPQLMATS